MSRFIAGFTLFICFSLPGFSQSLANVADASTTSLLGIGADHWSFYQNTEEESVYIDFETIDVNLHDIKLINASGEIILSEPLFDLPVNSIYELDLKGLPKGEYRVELRTFNDDVIVRPLTI